jgi:asparaginyl-tRNA synthetase
MRKGSNLWNEKTKAVLKIRANILIAAREWFDQHGYVEVHGPTIIPAVGDCPSSFEIKYFNKKAFLAQGLQPYARSFVASFRKIYTIAPTFRAEKLRNRRHLTEYWRIEVAQQCDLNGIIGTQEKLFTHICYGLLNGSGEELECLGRRTKDLARVKPPFPKLTYDEAIDILQKDGFNVLWGQMIDWELENHLSQKFDAPFFITEFPVSNTTFFFKSQADKPELTLSDDLIAPKGCGEVCSGGQMIDEKKGLLRKMEEEKVEKSSQDWYLNFVQVGSVPHSGFVVGIERVVQWICGLANIKKATAFPRTFDSFYP